MKSIVLNDEAFGKTQQERTDLLRRGGLKIYTTLDYRIQNPAAETMSEIVPANADNQNFGAAGVSVEVGTGRILSMTQNTMFTETPTDDQAYTSLVFAGDKDHGNSGGFQVGSTYKLFTLIDWLEKGHSINEVLNGSVQTNLRIPVCGVKQSTDTKKIGNFGGGGGGTSSVLNFTKNSLNSGYFAMASKLDVCEINKVADRMGVTLANGDKVTDENVPFDVLGPKNISPSPWRMRTRPWRAAGSTAPRARSTAWSAPTARTASCPRRPARMGCFSPRSQQPRRSRCRA